MLLFFVLAFWGFVCAVNGILAPIFGARWQAYCPFVIVWRA